MNRKKIMLISTLEHIQKQEIRPFVMNLLDFIVCGHNNDENMNNFFLLYLGR